MSLPFVRGAIVVLTLITAIIHLVLLNMNGLQPAFVANGLGFLALLAALLLKPAFLAGRERWVHYAYMAFTAVTIVAYFVVNQGESFNNPVGLFTKAVEVLLIIALWQHLRLTQPA